jgi:hypothetical protein
MLAFLCVCVWRERCALRARMMHARHAPGVARWWPVVRAAPGRSVPTCTRRHPLQPRSGSAPRLRSWRGPPAGAPLPRARGARRRRAQAAPRRAPARCRGRRRRRCCCGPTPTRRRRRSCPACARPRPRGGSAPPPSRAPPAATRQVCGAHVRCVRRQRSVRALRGFRCGSLRCACVCLLCCVRVSSACGAPAAAAPCRRGAPAAWGRPRPK